MRNVKKFLFGRKEIDSTVRGALVPSVPSTVFACTCGSRKRKSAARSRRSCSPAGRKKKKRPPFFFPRTLRRNVNISSREARDWSGDGSARRSSSLPFGAVDRLSSFSRRLSSKAFDEALPVLTSVSFFSDGRGKECSSPVPHFFHFRRQNARRGPRRNCRLVVVQEKRNLIYFVVLFCFAFFVGGRGTGEEYPRSENTTRTSLSSSIFLFWQSSSLDAVRVMIS